MPIQAPAQVKVGDLMQTRDDYPGERCHNIWRLYKGGRLFDPAIFLRKRWKEPDDIYRERLDRAFYIGYIGEIVDFFVANLFLNEPHFRIGKGGDLPEYYRRLTKNSDRAKTDWNAFDRDRWVRALVQGSAYTWVDLPSLPKDAEGKTVQLPKTVTAGQLDDLNLRDAYLIPLNANNLLYWERDEQGNFKHVIIHQSWTKRPTIFSGDRVRLHRWTIQVVDEFVVYEATEDLKWEDETKQWIPKDWKKFQNEMAFKVRGPAPHPFKQVPIAELCIDSALCIGEKLYDTQRHLTELDNGISWQQFCSLYAMLAVFSDKDFSQAVGEAYFMQMRPGEDAKYLEPAGAAIRTSMERRQQLQEELFRISHQMALAIRSEAGTAARSGESKRRDSTASEVILNHFGAIARDHQIETLNLIAAGRQETGHDFSVEGFDEFDIEELETFLGNMKLATEVEIESETFHKAFQKKTALRVLKGEPPELLEKIVKEIESADIVLPSVRRKEELESKQKTVPPGKEGAKLEPRPSGA